MRARNLQNKFSLQINIFNIAIIYASLLFADCAWLINLINAYISSL